MLCVNSFRSFFLWKKSRFRRITNRPLSHKWTWVTPSDKMQRTAEKSRAWGAAAKVYFKYYNPLFISTLYLKKKSPHSPPGRTILHSCQLSLFHYLLGVNHLETFARLLLPLWFPDHRYLLAQTKWRSWKKLQQIICFSSSITVSWTRSSFTWASQFPPSVH